VGYLEKRRTDAATEVEGFADLHGYSARYGLRDPGRRVEWHLALAKEGPDAGGMVRVPVGQEHGPYVVEVPPDPGEKASQPAAREPGV
jgi:hypothetical protein